VNNHEFIYALQNQDIEGLRKIPKSDLHNHAGLGSKLSKLSQWLGKTVAQPPEYMLDFEEFIDYLKTNLHAIIYSKSGFEYSIMAALQEALEDGVAILEMSIDAQVIKLYEDGSAGLVRFLKRAHASTAPDIDFRPEIGLNRELDLENTLPWVEPMIDSGYFKSIDLYGNEKFGEPEVFRGVFRLAKSKGLKLKAHAGEFRDADFVRRSVEILELDEVQHGIAAVHSAEVLSWLQRHQIRLNICPTSNVRLSRIKNLAAHPIRKIAEAGIPVTINSDDIMVFDQTVSEEYLNLYREKLFTAEELDQIRKEGLTA
jgi:adenosine deaminase